MTKKKFQFHIASLIPKVLILICFIQCLMAQDEFRGGCGSLQQKVHTIQINDNFQRNDRMLQTSVDPFNITPQFEFEFLRTYTSQVLQRMIIIAANYFQNLLKVTTINRDLTKFPSGQDCGSDVSISSKYYNDGFEQPGTDSVVFTVFEDRSDVSYVAKAGACALAKWPTYGIVYMNKYYVETDLDKKGQFHNNVLVVIHEMTHIYAFSAGLYTSLYYESYASSKRLSRSQVVDSINGRDYIITPNVKAYIQSFFGCITGTIGAKLQEDGGSGSASSHWERGVFLDQLMTASVWANGNRVTKLTTNLFLDTGFYYSVQVALADNSQFGKNQGCPFMTGSSTATPEYCSVSSTKAVCDFYSFYGGRCQIDSFSDSSGYVGAYTNRLCGFSEYASNVQKNNVYSPLSRCIMTDIGFGTQPNCFISTYSSASNSISIQIGSEKVVCGSADTTKTYSGGTITCPDITLFSSRANCQDWCDTRGVCINSKCVYANVPDFYYTWWRILLIVLGGVLIICCVGCICCCICYCVYRSRTEQTSPSPTPYDPNQNISAKYLDNNKAYY